MNLNRIETFKTSIYNQQHTKYTKQIVFFNILQTIQEARYADLCALFIFYVEGHTA